eukprot:TRINITY_DN45259_c0_g1_i1.p1 TRINITY_DN45259_c0_g1~~TRINITY_DN45259_c0_g1_i1.p1  ORF type:complete len:544 (-),score=73.34 TRINITY_DN45259_c0_g1_i1:392-2023(-)
MQHMQQASQAAYYAQMASNNHQVIGQQQGQYLYGAQIVDNREQYVYKDMMQQKVVEQEQSKEGDSIGCAIDVNQVEDVVFNGHTSDVADSSVDEEQAVVLKQGTAEHAAPNNTHAHRHAYYHNDMSGIVAQQANSQAESVSEKEELITQQGTIDSTIQNQCAQQLNGSLHTDAILKVDDDLALSQKQHGNTVQGEEVTCNTQQDGTIDDLKQALYNGQADDNQNCGDFTLSLQSQDASTPIPKDINSTHDLQRPDTEIIHDDNANLEDAGISNTADLEEAGINSAVSLPTQEQQEQQCGSAAPMEEQQYSPKISNRQNEIDLQNEEQNDFSATPRIDELRPEIPTLPELPFGGVKALSQKFNKDTGKQSPGGKNKIGMLRNTPHSITRRSSYAHREGSRELRTSSSFGTVQPLQSYGSASLSHRREKSYHDDESDTTSQISTESSRISRLTQRWEEGAPVKDDEEETESKPRDGSKSSITALMAKFKSSEIKQTKQDVAESSNSVKGALKMFQGSNPKPQKRITARTDSKIGQILAKFQGESK